jgi:hypothetical protein
MAHDIFISHSNKDKPIADAMCANLESAGLRCWIAPRDISSGEDWPTAIANAVSHSRVMVLVFSAHSNASDEVSRELFLAANAKAVIIPFKIENVRPQPKNQFYLAGTHWLDALNPPTQAQINQLVARVKILVAPIVPKVVRPIPWLPALSGLGLILVGSAVWLLAPQFLRTQTAAPLTEPIISLMSKPALIASQLSLTPTLDIISPTDTPRPNLTQTPTQTTILPKAATILPMPAGKLLFNNNFEDGSAHGFNFIQGDWKVVDDGTGNKVLEGKTNNGSSNAYFGPSDLIDGIFEIRFRVSSVDYQAQDHLVEFGFNNNQFFGGARTEDILIYDPAPPPRLILTYKEYGGPVKSTQEIFENGSIQNPEGSWTTLHPEGSWTTLRVEVQGKTIKVFANSNLFITVSDSRIDRGGLRLGALGSLITQFDDVKVWDLAK